MPRLFISYSRTDEAFARRLATSLSEMGADIWIDIRDIPAGMKWSSAIQQGLDICDAMMVVISPASMSSPNVEDEWQYYRDRGKPIVPVLLYPAQLHYQLGRLQYVNFYQQPYEVALTQLHAELWRKGIQLMAPPNAVTQPVPRVAPPPYRPVPSGAGGYTVPAAPVKQRRASPGLLTVGCIGLIIAGLGLGGAALVFSGGLLNAATATATESPTPEQTETPAVTPTPITPLYSQVVIAAESARLRTGPGVIFPTVDAFVLFGETYTVIAQSRSAADTETWFLIEHPRAGRVWISSVPVDLQPDGIVVPTAATVPPTPTSPPTAFPTMTTAPTSTPAGPAPTSSTLTLSPVFCDLQPSVLCSRTINSDRYQRVLVSVVPFASASLEINLYDSGGNLVRSSRANNLDAPVDAYRTYELQVRELSGASGSITIFVTLAEGTS